MRSASSRHGPPAKLIAARFAAILSIAAALAGVGMLCAAPTALAARVAVAGNTLSVTPTGSEHNVMEIASPSADALSVTDTGAAPQTDGTCPVTGATATCPAAGIARMTVNLGLQDDELTVTAQTRSLVSGREGNDVIRVRNGVPDQVDCGDGTDTLIGDPQDAPKNCESFDDGVPPETTITSTPPPPVFNPGDQPVEFEFTATESPVSFTCRLDAQFFSGCGSPFSTGLLDEGTHTFGVAATDQYGNADPTEATSTFVIDQTAPNTEITAAPPDITDTRTPTFEFTSTEDPPVFICQIDDSPDLFECGSPFTLPALENGTHKFTVRAQDAAGNFDQTGASRTFIVASSTPVPPKLTKPPFVVVLGSIVLISGRTAKMSKQGVVPVSLNCAGSQVCKGRMSLTTADPVRITARKIAKLGSVKFRIKPQHKKLIRVRLGKSARKLVKRLRRVRTRATIREVDLRGNPRISSRIFTLRK